MSKSLPFSDGGLSFCLKECCFRVRVRVRVSVNPNPNHNPNPKTAFFEYKTDPGPGPAPNPTPTSSPRFTDTQLLPHKLCKNLHSSGVYTSPCNSGAVPVRSSCAPCRRSHVNERQIRFHKCLSVQNFVRVRVKGVSL